MSTEALQRLLPPALWHRTNTIGQWRTFNQGVICVWPAPSPVDEPNLKPRFIQTFRGLSVLAAALLLNACGSMEKNNASTEPSQLQIEDEFIIDLLLTSESTDPYYEKRVNLFYAN